MTKFKEFLSLNTYHAPVEFPSVSVKYKEYTLSIRFDSRDVVQAASFEGPNNPWLSSLCFLISGKTLNEISNFNWKTWDDAFKSEQVYWDIKHEAEDLFLNDTLELLKASIDVFRGREYLYQETSPLICRCFGVRESDVLEHLHKEAVPTLETLAGVSKAGMGCRSCVPQLKRWLVLHETKKHNHRYKHRALADWLIQIDAALSEFSLAKDWKMEVQAFKNQQVTISFEKEVTQKEEEKAAKDLQLFLAGRVDTGLAFFLRRARHFSKANG